MAGEKGNGEDKRPEKMDLGEENEEQLLMSSSAEQTGSTSSSILLLGDDDDNDGINVTIRPLVPNEVPASTPTNQMEEKKGKLSGAKKKRFAKLLQDGLSRADAFLLVQSSGSSSTPKRVRNMNESNNSGGGDDNPDSKRKKDSSARGTVNYRLQNIRDGRPATVPAAKQHQPTYGEVAKWVQVGILPVGFPQKQLTAQQMDILEETILFRVTQQRREMFKPKFMNCWRRTGHLIINCQDVETAEWLESLMAILSPWEGAVLEAVDADVIPRLEVMEGLFYRSVAVDNDTIMVYLESQNDGLSTGNWRVIQRKVLREQHVRLLFTVDEATMRLFKDNDYVLNYKFGQTIIRKHIGEVAERNDDKNKKGKEVGMVDDSGCTGNVICMSPGNNALLENREEQQVPGTSQSHKSNAEGESTSHLNQNKQSSGPKADQGLSKAFKSNPQRKSIQNTTQISGTQSNFSEQSSRDSSDQLVDRRRLNYSLDQNGDGRSTNKNYFVPGKNQNPPTFKKQGNYSGSSANRSNSDPSKQRRKNGSPKGIQRKGQY